MSFYPAIAFFSNTKIKISSRNNTDSFEDTESRLQGTICVGIENVSFQAKIRLKKLCFSAHPIRNINATSPEP